MEVDHESSDSSVPGGLARERRRNFRRLGGLRRGRLFRCSDSRTAGATSSGSFATTARADADSHASAGYSAAPSAVTHPAAATVNVAAAGGRHGFI
jgi:hypothetical protein